MNTIVRMVSRLLLAGMFLLIHSGCSDSSAPEGAGGSGGEDTVQDESDNPGTLLTKGEAETLMYRGADLYASGEYDPAIEIFDQIADARIDGPDGTRLRAVAAHNIGACYQDGGRLEDSIIAFKRAVEIDPEYARAYNSIGNSYMDMGNIDMAEKNYQKAVEVDPRQSDAHYNLGNLLEDDEEAIDHYNKALMDDPDNATCHHNKGVRLLNLGRTDEALASVRKAIRLEPGYGRAYCTRGIILESLGNTAAAEEDFTMARKLGVDVDQLREAMQSQ